MGNNQALINEIIVDDEIFETSLVTVDKEYLDSQGYTKLSKETFERIDFLVQFIPGQVAQKMTIDTANMAITEMAKDAYKVLVKEGMHLGKSSTLKGAFKGMLFLDGKNKLSGSADLIPLEPATIPRTFTPRIMLGIFNAMSLVTGMYYLSSINNTLTNLSKGTDKILAFLELDRRSEILADAETLERYITFLSFIVENDIQKQSASVDFKSIERSSLSKINSFVETIDNITKEIHEDARPETVKNKLAELRKYFPQYWYAVRNYNLAATLDAVVSEMDDPQYLDSVEANIRRQVFRYQTSVSKTMDAYDRFMEGSEELNEKQSANNGRDYYELRGVPASVHLGNLVAEFMDSQRVETSIYQKIQAAGERIQFLEACNNLVPLNEIVKMVKEYRKIRNNPVELIVTREEAYIKIIE